MNPKRFPPRKAKKRGNFKFKLKIYLFLFLLGLLATGAIYILRESPIFKIREVKVLGLDKAEGETLIQNIESQFVKSKLKVLLGYDNFLVWPKETSFANLEYASLEIRKKFLSRTIEIAVKKRERLGIWCDTNGESQNAKRETLINESQSAVTAGSEINRNAENNSAGGYPLVAGGLTECFWFDEEGGLLFESAPIPSGLLILKVIGTETPELNLGDQILPAELFQNFRKITEFAGALNLPLEGIEVNRKRQEATLTASGGAEFIFSLRFEPNAGIFEAIQKILSETPLSKIDYIDLTVENKIYLRTK